MVSADKRTLIARVLARRTAPARSRRSRWCRPSPSPSVPNWLWNWPPRPAPTMSSPGRPNAAWRAGTASAPPRVCDGGAPSPARRPGSPAGPGSRRWTARCRPMNCANTWPAAPTPSCWCCTSRPAAGSRMSPLDQAGAIVLVVGPEGGDRRGRTRRAVPGRRAAGGPRPHRAAHLDGGRRRPRGAGRAHRALVTRPHVVASSGEQTLKSPSPGVSRVFLRLLAGRGERGSRIAANATESSAAAQVRSSMTVPPTWPWACWVPPTKTCARWRTACRPRFTCAATR